jgi:type III secretory pathway component EscR
MASITQMNVLGIKIDINLVKKPVLKKILENMQRDIVRYSEHSQSSGEEPYKEYHSKYSEYREYYDKTVKRSWDTNAEYSDRSVYDEAYNTHTRGMQSRERWRW